MIDAFPGSPFWASLSQIWLFRSLFLDLWESMLGRLELVLDLYKSIFNLCKANSGPCSSFQASGSSFHVSGSPGPLWVKFGYLCRSLFLDLCESSLGRWELVLGLCKSSFGLCGANLSSGCREFAHLEVDFDPLRVKFRPLWATFRHWESSLGFKGLSLCI